MGSAHNTFFYGESTNTCTFSMGSAHNTFFYGESTNTFSMGSPPIHFLWGVHQYIFYGESTNTFSMGSTHIHCRWHFPWRVHAPIHLSPPIHNYEESSYIWGVQYIFYGETFKFSMGDIFHRSQLSAWKMYPDITIQRRLIRLSLHATCHYIKGHFQAKASITGKAGIPSNQQVL